MNLEHFLNMGGYAAYVWPSYGLALMVLSVNLVATRRRHRQVLRQVSARVRSGTSRP